MNGRETYFVLSPKSLKIRCFCKNSLYLIINFGGGRETYKEEQGTIVGKLPLF
jgi:hypothetical protein